MDIEKLIDNMQRKGFIVHQCSDEQQTNDVVSGLISCGQSVGIGGSMTIKQLGIEVLLQQKGVEVLSHALVSEDKRADLYEYARHADWYMSSANAVTQKGDLINIDGTANRVSTLIYGVPNVIYIVGKNKIVDNLEQAIERIKTVTCPQNAERLDRKTPCRYTGVCGDCSGKDCMCNVTVIVHHPTKLQKQVHIILVDKELGY
ncbi:MAG: lactate utilization protein [Christensenellales bacterium]